MPSAWGSSWNQAWGNSWGIIGAEVIVPAPEAPRPGGAFWARQPYRRIRHKAVEVIEQVAQRQVQDLRLDDTQKLQELMGELEARAIDFDQRYVKALQARREFLIDQEIAERFKERLRIQAEDEEVMIFMILSTLQ